MRCFISIDIPEEVRREVKRIQEKLPDFSGKKTESENLHLTLKFLGEIDEEKIEKVKKELKKVKLNKFEAEVKHAGFFDNKKYGVIWLYLSDCENIQKAVDGQLEDLFQPENRFMSHLTIARVKKKLEDKKEFLEQLNKIKIEKMNFVVDKFKLKKSTLTSKGPVYETIEEYGLD